MRHHLCSRCTSAWKASFAAGLARQSHVTGIVQSDYATALAGRLHFSIYRRNVFGMLDKI